MAKIPIYNTPEDKHMFYLECEACDENRWRNMVLSIKNRTMTKIIYKQLNSSLRQCMWKIRGLQHGCVPSLDS